MSARLGTGSLASQRQIANGAVRPGLRRSAARADAARDTRHRPSASGRRTRADGGGILQLRRTQRCRLRQVMARPRQNTGRRHEVVPQVARPPDAEHEKRRQSEPHRRHAPRLIGAGRCSAVGFAGIEIHDAEMIEEADEDDDQQHHHDIDGPVVAALKAGAQDDKLAEEQAERRRAGDRGSAGKPQRALHRKRAQTSRMLRISFEP